MLKLRDTYNRQNMWLGNSLQHRTVQHVPLAATGNSAHIIVTEFISFYDSVPCRCRTQQRPTGFPAADSAGFPPVPLWDR